MSLAEELLALLPHFTAEERDEINRLLTVHAPLWVPQLGPQTQALNSPADVRGLVLLCPAVAFRKLRQLVPFVRLVPDEIAALPVRIPRRMAMAGLRGLFADPSRLPDAWYEAAIDEFVRVLSIRANRLAAFSALRNIYLDEPFGESGFWDRLPALEPPALFVWGDKDVLVPAGFARFVSDALPTARTVVSRAFCNRSV